MGDAREVHLTLVGPDGTLLGALPPLTVELEWENDIGALVAAVRDRLGLDITVLRMRWVHGFEEGGPVGYLAELADPTAVRPQPAHEHPDARPETAPHGHPRVSLGVAEAEADEPLRAPWARAGGPAATVRWADGVLAGLGRPRTGAAVQTRTWGLSAIWWLPTAAGRVWLKRVPAYFAHEGAVIGWLNRRCPGTGPALLAHDGDTVLLADLPGGEIVEPTAAVRRGSLNALVGMQAVAARQLAELRRLGVPDRRAAHLPGRFDAVVDTWSAAVPEADRAALDALLDGLPDRLRRVAECGVPDTLVHGDFHAGNILRNGAALVIIDWGDSQLGHPALDLLPFLTPLPAAHRAGFVRHWADRWRRAVPGSDPERAAGLMLPVAALGQACAYDMFIRGAEPGERVWHEKYVLRWLRRTAAAAGGRPDPVFG